MFTCTLNPSTYFSFANSQALIEVVGRVKLQERFKSNP